MEYRLLGNTGLALSVLGFGAAPFGGAYGAVDEQNAARSLALAIDHGVNFIDVAPYYGVTRAEYVLGRALATISRDSYYLCTKVGRYDKADFDFSAQRVTASVDESLRRLGVDYLDLIICHDIEFGSIAQIVDETIPALRRVQQAGKVGFVGVSGLPLKIFRDVAAQTEIDFVLSYCRYCLYDTALADLAPLLGAKGIGIISASPLSMGLLTDGGPPEWHPAPSRLRNACRDAARYCRDHGANIAELALQFSLAQTAFATTLVGMSSPAEVESNLRQLARTPDETLLREVLEIFRPVRNLTWPSGRPENNDAAAVGA